MATNSILDNLTCDDMISTIRLEIGADVNKEKTFLVVEGNDDKKFFNLYLGKFVYLLKPTVGRVCLAIYSRSLTFMF